MQVNKYSLIIRVCVGVPAVDNFENRVGIKV